MKKFYLALAMMMGTSLSGYSQFFFPVEVKPEWAPTTVVMPPSPLKYQVLFIGQTHKVQTTGTYGNAPGQALAKQWHDFIGFTPDENSSDLGWVTVNHEMVERNDSIGDGGGMTVFKVRRDPVTDTLIIVNQTLADGRTGKFFNIDFVNTVGETGMNCGGISSIVDGRIWTAEEWFRNSNAAITPGVRNQSEWKINTDIPGDFAGASIPKFQNFNWMVEVDPREAKAIRKQYNWGRQGFEGGIIMPDNKTVYTAEDATPGLWGKFVADTPGDFTKGKTYVYKHDAKGPDGPWVEMNNRSLETMLNIKEEAMKVGATMFNRLEWPATDGKRIFVTETGSDNIGNAFKNGAAKGGVLDKHWIAPVKKRHSHLATKTDEQILDFVRAGFFNDYYGRVLEFHPETGLMTTFLEGGPMLDESPSLGAYPKIHFSNPDGLNFLHVNGQSFMLIQEDLNGLSKGRVPAGVTRPVCEMYLLDMKIKNPTVNDLVRISATPMGAEITGAQPTPDGKTLMVNSQHPDGNLPFPYNNSLTYAITGWDAAVSAIGKLRDEAVENKGFKIWPNPVARELNFNEVIDVAVYDLSGKRVKVARNVDIMDVADLKPGTYLLKTFNPRTNQEGSSKVVIQK